LQGSGKRSLAYVAAAILLAGVLVSATLILVPLSRPPRTVTATLVTTATETTTLTSTMTSTQTTMSTSSFTAFSTTLATTCDESTSTNSSDDGSVNGGFCEANVTFGDGDTPSAIFIPANTLTWVPLAWDTNASSYRWNYVVANVILVECSVYGEGKITVGVYGHQGTLINADDFELASGWANSCAQDPFDSIGATPNGTANQVISVPNWQNIPNGAFPAFPDNVTLQQGSTFYVAVVATRSIWLGGFSASDRSGGTGLAYGQSPWEAPVTYEGAMGQQPNATLPNSLPQAVFTSTFEMSVAGNVGIPYKVS
jgi:hypothetical protein